MAMQSSCLLARMLIARQSVVTSSNALSEIGETYRKEWKALFGSRIRAAAAFAHLFMRPGMATLYLPLVRKFPGLLTLGANLSGKTTQLKSANSVWA